MDLSFSENLDGVKVKKQGIQIGRKKYFLSGKKFKDEDGNTYTEEQMEELGKKAANDCVPICRFAEF